MTGIKNLNSSDTNIEGSIPTNYEFEQYSFIFYYINPPAKTHIEVVNRLIINHLDIKYRLRI